MANKTKNKKEDSFLKNKNLNGYLNPCDQRQKGKYTFSGRNIDL